MTNRERHVAAARRSKQQRAATLLDIRPLRHARQLTTWRGVLVLNYHRIGRAAGSPWDHTLWSSSAEDFDDQVREIARNADVIGPGDLTPELTHGRGRRVLLTFDDGYRDNHELALPILRAHGVPALFFVVSGFVDRGTTAWWDEIAWMVHSAAPDRSIRAGASLDADIARTPGDGEQVVRELIARYKELPGSATNDYLDHLGDVLETGRCHGDQGHWMTWDMVREMQAAGMGVGGHTVTHPVLARLPVAEQRAEIHGCAARLEEELGGPMRWFSYPVGARSSFTLETQAIVRETGAELAFSFYGGVGQPYGQRLFDVRRIHVGPSMALPLLQATVAFPRLFARTDPAP